MDLDDLFDQLAKTKPIKAKKPSKPKKNKNPLLEPLKPDYFHGKTVVFTGKFEGRTQLMIQNLTAAAGAKISGTVVNSTDILVCGGRAASSSSKSIKALNIPGVDYILEAEWEIHFAISEKRVTAVTHRELDPYSGSARIATEDYLEAIDELAPDLRHKYEDK